MAAGRRRVLPQEDLRTEVLVALRPEQFLTYAFFERLATGMDPGERLLPSIGSSRIGVGQSAEGLGYDGHPPNPPQDIAKHPLLRQLGLGTSELLEVLGGSFRLMAAVRGSVAEYHLGVDCFGRFPVSRRCSTSTRTESQTSRSSIGSGPYNWSARMFCVDSLLTYPRVDFQKTRASKRDPCSRYYRAKQFDILAACLHPVTERWEFRFCATHALAHHPRCTGRLSEHVRVAGAEWNEDLRIC